MSKPKHQHFIPQSYLKNFSVKTDGKYFVEAKLKDEELPKSRLISIKDICVDRNIYTIPNATDEKKYLLEKFYAAHVDSVYPEVYELLVNPEVTNITAEQRVKIILTTMSLFFRTPKFLNLKETRLDAILKYGINNHQDKNGNVKFSFKNQTFDFHVQELEQYKSDLKIKNKVEFLKQHFEDWYKFVEFKINAGIAVYKVIDAVDLISSDNPVIIHNPYNKPFDVFEPTNIIALPLDNKHFMKIMPNTIGGMNRIVRADRDKMFAFGINRSVEDESDDWIFGISGSVASHIIDQNKYMTDTHENWQAVETMRERTLDMKLLVEVMEVHGATSEKVGETIKELMKKEIHRDNLEMSNLIKELRIRGVSIEIPIF